MVDMLVLMAVTALLGALVAVGSYWVGNYAFAVYGVLSFLLFLGYWIFFELRWQGRSPGKRLLGLRVVGERGLPLDFSQVLLRNLLRPVDTLPGAAGLAALCCALQCHHRRLGDLVAGTLVIRERRPRRPGAILSKEVRAQVQAASTLSLFPSQLMSRLSPAEVEFILDLCSRRDSLLNSVRLQLFSAVATELRDRFAVGRSDSLSAETLVLLICSQLIESEEKTA